jgi:hypothetical protein
VKIFAKAAIVEAKFQVKICFDKKYCQPKGDILKNIHVLRKETLLF